jgi:acyl-CoA dehydrogenase
VGCAKLATRVCSAHSVVRSQFGVSIGKFEGVEEPLARIFAFTYGLEAMRKYTLGALDQGIKPPVITAMVKYYTTEIGRTCINDAMDVMGGAGISMGPKNLLAQIYIGTPIGITVEGANILTRTLIVFGQGALRAHPYAYKEVAAVESNDLKGFDSAFWGHIGHIVRNSFRALLLSLTRGYLATSPVSGPTAHYYRRLTWASASFAILADIAMGVLGGSLKFREKITGRFADILAYMYFSSAVLKRFEAEGRRSEDLPMVDFVLKYNLAQIQKAFDGIYDNIKVPGLRWLFKGWMGGWSRINSMGSQGSDGLGSRVVTSILSNLEQRDRFTEGIFISKNQPHEQMAKLDHAMVVTLKAEATERKVRQAIRDQKIPKKKGLEALEEAKKAGVITSEEYALVKESSAIRADAIQVDDFSEADFKANYVGSPSNGHFKSASI